MLKKLAFYEKQRFALFGINNPDIFALSEKKTFFTPDFKKRQNRNETSLKNGTKFTGIFASLVIKLSPKKIIKNIENQLFKEMFFTLQNL